MKLASLHGYLSKTHEIGSITWKLQRHLFTEQTRQFEKT